MVQQLKDCFVEHHRPLQQLWPIVVMPVLFSTRTTLLTQISSNSHISNMWCWASHTCNSNTLLRCLNSPMANFDTGRVPDSPYSKILQATVNLQVCCKPVSANSGTLQGFRLAPSSQYDSPSWSRRWSSSAQHKQPFSLCASCIISDHSR